MLASVLRTVIVYVAVITGTRLMGKRQLGELQPAELVTTFLISNVASICIDEPDLPLAASIVPIFLLTALEILNSTLAWFCPRYARLLFGKPITVIVRGEIRQQALQELRITASDLMEALRGKEYFSPTELLWATVEPNGSISTAPVPQNSEAPPMLPLLLEGRLFVAQNADGGWYAVQGQEVYLPDTDRLAALLDSDAEIWAFDAKPLYRLALEQGHIGKALHFDGKLAAYLLNPSASSYAVKSLAAEYGVAAAFHCEASPDAGVLAALPESLAAALDASGQLKQHDEMQQPLARVLADMASHGIAT